MSFLSKATNIPKPGVKPPSAPPRPTMFKPTLPTLPKDNAKEEVKEVTKEVTKPAPVKLNTPPKMPKPALDLDQTDLDGEPLVLDSQEPVQEVEQMDVTHCPDEAITSKEEQIIQVVKEKEATQEVKEEVKENTLTVSEEGHVNIETTELKTNKPKLAELPKEEETKEEVVQEESPKEEKPKKSSRSRKKATDKETEKDSAEPVELYNKNLKHISVEDMDEYLLGAVIPYSESWEAEKEEISGVISELKITSDMNPGQAKVLLEELAEAQFVCTTNLTKAKTNYENLIGDNGLIKAVKAMNSKGSNADDRKVSGLIACMNYVKPGESKATDLLMYERLVRDKFYFYENAVKQIEFKRQLLITFNGMLNIESRL